MKSLSPELAGLLDTPETPELGPGPRGGVRAIKQIEREVEAALRASETENKELALAVVLLWHDHLDASHEIAQKHETQDGSYVHAIMHRREPDYDNAKYWFRRVGRHACYAELAKEIANRRGEDLPKRLAPGGEWDAMAFVDACEAVARGKLKAAVGETLREIQAMEFRLLLKHLSL